MERENIASKINRKIKKKGEFKTPLLNVLCITHASMGELHLNITPYLRTCQRTLV